MRGGRRHLRRLAAWPRERAANAAPLFATPGIRGGGAGGLSVDPPVGGTAPDADDVHCALALADDHALKAVQLFTACLSQRGSCYSVFCSQAKHI